MSAPCPTRDRAGLALWGALLVGLAACGGDEFSVTVRFDDAGLLAEARTLEVHLLDECGDLGATGGDPAGPRLSASVPLPGEAPRLGRIEPGSYGLYARARNGACRVVAAGCSPVDLEPGGGRELAVTVGAADGPACGPSERCDGGSCVPGPAADGDADSDADGDAEEDAEVDVEEDAEVEPPCEPTDGWTQTFDITTVSPVFVAAGPGGDVAAAGMFTGTADLDPDPDVRLEHTASGEADTFAVRLDADGGFRWGRVLGGDGVERVRAVSVCGDGSTLLAGELTGRASIAGLDLVAPGFRNGFVVRLDAAGLPSWSWVVGSWTSTVEAASCDEDGVFVVAGEFVDTVDFDPDPERETPLTAEDASDAFVAVFEPGGTLRWAAAFHGTGTDRVTAAEIAPDGLGLVVAGEFDGTIDLDPGAAAVPAENAPDSVYDLFVVRLDGRGGYLWGHTIERDVQPNSRSPRLAFAPGLEVVLAANIDGSVPAGVEDGGVERRSATGSENVFVLRYRGDGTHRWSRRFGGGGQGAEANGIAVARDGSTLMPIVTWLSPTDLDPEREHESGADLYSFYGMPDAVLSRIDPNGVFLGGLAFGGDSHDYAYDAAAVPAGVGAGAAIVSGAYFSAIDFDPGPCADVRPADADGGAYVTRLPVAMLVFGDE